MAKQFKQTKSDDALTIHILGDVRKPEPGSCIVKFPGGHVEITRCTDNTYWAHLEVVDPRNIVDSRIDYTHTGWLAIGKIPEIAMSEHIKKLALRVDNTIPHFDPDAGHD